MRKLLVVVLLAASVAFFPTPEVTAQERDAEHAQQLEDQAVALENLLRAVAGPVEAGPVIDYGDGLHGIAFSVDDAARLLPTKAKDLQVLAHGHQLSDPSVLSSLINSVSANTILEYKFWWVVLNSTSSDIDAVTVRKVKGPRGGLRNTERSELTYPANTIQLFWDDPEEELGAEGVFLHKVVVKGWGNLKAWFWAD